MPRDVAELPMFVSGAAESAADIRFIWPKWRKVSGNIRTHEECIRSMALATNEHVTPGLEQMLEGWKGGSEV